MKAEHLYWVHGKHGEDPFAGASSQDYAFPPVKHEPRIQELSDGLSGMGLHPFHLPIGVNLIQNPDGTATHGSACIRCDRVDGFPCLVEAKADAESVAIRPALVAHPNLRLLTGTTVTKLLTDATGQVGDRGRDHNAARRADDIHRRHRRALGRARSCRRRCCSPRPRMPTRTASRTDRMSSAGTTCATTTSL